jgi:hypothetical protein
MKQRLPNGRLFHAALIGPAADLPKSSVHPLAGQPLILPLARNSSSQWM